jgi:acyl-CoA thioesterase-1
MGRSAAVPGAFVAAAFVAAALHACGGESEGPIERTRPGPAAAAGAAANGEPRATEGAGPAAAAERPLVVFLGDSLTAGYGLAEGDAYPARIEAALAAEGRPVRVVNAGVSGDTSAGGLSRLDWVLRLDPAVVVVELGPNDGLRGLPLDATEANLRRIVERIEAAGARVLLVGLLIPPNYGPDYAGRFAAIYPRLAAELDVPLVPFLLDGVGGEPDLNLADGIHPNAAGHRRLAENVLPHLRPLLAGAVPGAAAGPPAD